MGRGISGLVNPISIGQQCRIFSRAKSGALCLGAPYPLVAIPTGILWRLPRKRINAAVPKVIPPGRMRHNTLRRLEPGQLHTLGVACQNEADITYS